MGARASVLSGGN
nr:gag protein [Human immunodeficiency virus 1]